MDNIINYLINKGASDDLINYILLSKGDDKNIIDKLNYIYHIFNVIGLNDDEITEILQKNKSLFRKSYDDIMKTAYVLKNTGIEKDVFEVKSMLGYINLYKRLYVRNEAFKNSGINFKGATTLLSRENEAYDNKSNLNRAAKNSFGLNYPSDDELIDYLGGKAIFEILNDKIYRIIFLKELNKNGIDYNDLSVFKEHEWKEYALDLKILKEAREFFKQREFDRNDSVEKQTSKKR